MKDEYRRIAPLYDVLLDGFNEGLRGIGLKLYPPNASMRVLDVCCGTGAQLVPYKEAGCSVRGIDRSPAMLAQARRKLGADAITEGDARSLPFGNASFDLILCTLALHEMDPEDRRATIAEMSRVAAENGHLLIIDFHPGPFRFPKGWISAAGIFVAELTAGWGHFRNGRRFLREGGVSAFTGNDGPVIERQRIVGGGTFSVTLFHPGNAHRNTP